MTNYALVMAGVPDKSLSKDPSNDKLSFYGAPNRMVSAGGNYCRPVSHGLRPAVREDKKSAKSKFTLPLSEIQHKIIPSE